MRLVSRALSAVCTCGAFQRCGCVVAARAYAGSRSTITIPMPIWWCDCGGDLKESWGASLRGRGEVWLDAWISVVVTGVIDCHAVDCGCSQTWFLEGLGSC